MADSPTAVGNCCAAISVVVLLLLLFSLFPYFLGLVIAHIVRGISIQSAGILLLGAASQCG